MMVDDTTLLMLQHGDSAFPSGAVSFSWGLETMLQDGLISTAGHLKAYVEGQLCFRWATNDRAALVAAWTADGDLDRAIQYDWRFEAQTLAAELRDGSRRVGSAILAVHCRLGGSCAAAYQNHVRLGAAPGHLPVVQGLLWRDLGLACRQAELMSACGLMSGLTAAAIRLGLIGHLDAQRIITAMHPVVMQVLQSPPPPIDRMHAFTPAGEIAAMRHETGEVRLFSN